MADMMTKEQRQRCATGDYCFECPFDDCVYEGMTQRGIREATENDKAAKFAGKDKRAQRIAAQQREYYEANKDKIAAQQREYYEANKDKIAAKQRVIFDHRKAAKLSQSALGRKLGVSQRTISFWETGRVPCDWRLLETVFPGIEERSNL